MSSQLCDSSVEFIDFCIELFNWKAASSKPFSQVLVLFLQLSNFTLFLKEKTTNVEISVSF